VSGVAGAGLVATLVGLAAAGFLWVFFVVGWRQRISGRATLSAATGTLLWLSLLTVFWLSDPPDRLLGTACGVARALAYALWFGVGLRVLGIGLRHVRADEDPQKTWLLGACAAVAALGLAGTAAELAGLWLVPDRPLLLVELTRLAHTGLLLMAVTGLVLMEQVARNTRRDSQWNLKYFVVGLAIVYGYGFVLEADAVMFRQPNPALAAAHGAVIALAAPFLVIATVRNRTQRLRVNLSRQLVFRTGTLVITGAYLLLISAGGFWLREFGGNWGEVLAVLFVTGTLVVGLVLAWSRTLRERFSVALARNFFANKHDYRDEWLRVTAAMLSDDSDASLGQRAVRALGDTIHAHRGGLWKRSGGGALVPAAQLKTAWDRPLTPAATTELCALFETFDGPWVLRAPPPDGAPAVPAARAELSALQDAWVALPLLHGDALYGLVVLTQPETGEALDWEDDEILRVAARQIASFLALQDASDVLGRHRQVAAFNQMTAFVVHDLKTVVAQLSLLTQNADKHRGNPAFVDDMVRTTEHAVGRMQGLLAQLREQRAPREDAVAPMPVRELLERVTATRSHLRPVPALPEDLPGDVCVCCDRDRLVDALGHLVQNAQEATPDDGTVAFRVDIEDRWAVIALSDTGAGMTPEFVAERLFRPFASTKGLAGMGVGTWQARETVRTLGGDVTVDSRPGEGTVFTVRLPLCGPDGAAPGTDATHEPSEGEPLAGQH
jgi:putative PEP-CTERM system histidine kinase